MAFYPRLQTIKKLEIVIETIKLDQVIQIIEEAGASGYTILPSVTGRGTRGQRLGGGLTDVFKNAMVITLVDEAIATKILQKVERLIQNFAGMAVVTDALALWPDYSQETPKPPGT
ncbi:MAG TPA: P-II family nitrogen regulator [Nitrospiria bacterium]|jgi:nitrogen regulatory protein PII